MLPRTISIWQRDSQPDASGRPGAVQPRLIYGFEFVPSAQDVERELSCVEGLRGLETSDAKRLRTLEEENGRLKRLVADKILRNPCLKDVQSNILMPPAVIGKAIAFTGDAGNDQYGFGAAVPLLNIVDDKTRA